MGALVVLSRSLLNHAKPKPAIKHKANESTLREILQDKETLNTATLFPSDRAVLRNTATAKLFFFTLN